MFKKCYFSNSVFSNIDFSNASLDSL
ncbi:pentapeptide repeat-containing protein [Candidatus Enterococcus lemimoniae]